VARAKSRAVRQALSPADVVAKQAEELAASRLNLTVNGHDFVTDEYTIDVAKMYKELLEQ